MRFLKKHPSKDKIEKSIEDAFYIILEDIIEEYDLENIDNIDPDIPELPDDYWFYNGTYYGDTLVRDRITISISSSTQKYDEILEKIKELKPRIEGVTNFETSIEKLDVDIYKWPNGEKPKGRVVIKLKWKGLKDRYNDVKKFIGLINPYNKK